MATGDCKGFSKELSIIFKAFERVLCYWEAFSLYKCIILDRIKI